MVQGVREEVVEDLDTFLYVLGLLRVLDRVFEQVLEPLQRVLVHVIDNVQVDNTKEEKLRAERNRAEAFSLHINFFLSNFRLGLTRGDLS